MVVVSKVEKINHGDHKESAQSSQIAEKHCFNFVTIVVTLCTLWLTMTFETTSFARLLNRNLYRIASIPVSIASGFSGGH